MESANFGDLPYEVLCIIMEYLTYDQLKNVRQVSNILKMAADEVFMPRTLLYVQSSALNRLEMLKYNKIQNIEIHRLYSRDIASVIRILNGGIHTLPIKLKLFEYDIDDELFWKFIDAFPNLRVLHLDSPCNYQLDYLKIMINCSYKVSKLILHDECYDFDVPTDVIPMIPNKRITLKSLNIRLCPTIEFLKNYFMDQYFLSIHKSLRTFKLSINDFREDALEWFIKTNFKNLRCIDLQIPGDMEIESTRNLLNIISGQEMTNYYGTILKSVDELICSRLKVITLFTLKYSKTNDLFGELNFSRLKYLEKLTITMPYILKDIIFSENAKKRMKEIELNCPFENTVITSIAMNASNLQSLRLNDEDNSVELQYIRLIFLRLNKLRSLFLSFRGNTDKDPTVNISGHIGQLIHLRTVYIKGLNMCPPVALCFLERALELEDVTYYYTQAAFQEDIVSLLKDKPRIRKFEFIHTFGRTKPDFVLTEEEEEEICENYPHKVLINKSQDNESHSYKTLIEFKIR